VSVGRQLVIGAITGVVGVLLSLAVINGVELVAQAARGLVCAP